MKPDSIAPGYNPEKTKAIILEGRTKGKTWSEIEKALNKEGLVTKQGKRWGTGNACNVALTHGWVTRVVNTSAGSAGSTGNAYSTFNGRTVRRKTAPKAKEGITDMEMDEIWTSNLNPTLKRKVTRLLAIHGEM